MSGWYRMKRGWQSHAFFAREPYTEREAWEWLISAAAYKPHSVFVKGRPVSLEIGEIATTQRDLAEEWKWGRQRVRGYVKRLVAAAMVELLDSSEENATQSVTHLRVCNYTRFQSEQPKAQPSSNPGATQQQPTIEEGKEGEEGKEQKAAPAYAFEGEVMRLTQADFDAWRAKYHAIPDFRAELETLDAYYASDDPEKAKRWWHRAPSALNKSHQYWLTRPKARPVDTGEMALPC